jgi:hypothetical protein
MSHEATKTQDEPMSVFFVSSCLCVLFSEGERLSAAHREVTHGKTECRTSQV